MNGAPHADASVVRPRRSHPKRTGRLVLDLLRFAAGTRQQRADGPVWIHGPSPWLEQAALDDIGAAGLIPLLHEAASSEFERLPRQQRELLVAARFSAMLRHDAFASVAADVVEVAQRMRIPVTLLKGISIGEQHYSAPYLRPMGDIDILVSPVGRRRLQSALQRRGYEPLAGNWDRDPHAAPLCHPQSPVWVEVHDALFPRDSRFAAGTVFGPESLSARSEPHSLLGMPVRRLSDELQLVYIASYWVRDLSRHAPHPSFLVPLFDAVRLLHACPDRIDWQRMQGWVDNETAAASLYVMLSYLDRHGLAGAAAGAVPQLARQQALLGPLELRLLHALLDRWLVDGLTPAIGRRAYLAWDRLLSSRRPAAKLAGLPWALLFPADVPDRFSVAHMRRMASRLATARNRPEAGQPEPAMEDRSEETGRYSSR